MHSKNHRQNHNFQIKYFLMGACFTPDGMYALLCDLKEEREMALEAYEVGQIRNEATELKANQLLSADDPIKKLKGKAKLLELEQGRKRGKVLYEAAMDELKFINECIEKIEPLRKYKHLPDPEAHEACQEEEWKLELIHRAENYVLTTGTVPADHFSTMRQHPQFKDAILPVINELTTLIRTEEGRAKLTEQMTQQKLLLG